MIKVNKKMKDGSIKVYEYDKETQKKYYENRRNKLGGFVSCDLCGRHTLKSNLESHKSKKICINNRKFLNIQNNSINSDVKEDVKPEAVTIVNENLDDNIKKVNNGEVIIIYKGYSEAQKRGNKKWLEKNKDKNREYSKKYYAKMKENKEYIEKKRQKAREAYQNKKKSIIV